MGWFHRRRRRFSLTLLLTVGAILGGCASNLKQTPFDPHGPVARAQLDLLNLSLYFAIGIGAIVSALLLFIVLRYRQRPGTNTKVVPPQIHGNTKLEIIWTIIPIVILAIVGVPTVQAAFKIAAPSAPAALTVKAIGHQWWFEFQYPDQKFVTANELYIPVGKPVVVKIESNDVIHSFWVPKLAGKTDMIPNRTNQAWLQADEEGSYYGQCAEFCGPSHARMGFRVIAVSQEKFDAWVRERQAGAKQPTSELAVAGKALFEGKEANKAVCFSCHAIDGSAKSVGKVGPNLSNVGSRATIAAGVLDNTEENLRKWIRDPQSVKPGAKMVAHPKLTDNDLLAITTYLQSLK